MNKDSFNDPKIYRCKVNGPDQQVPKVYPQGLTIIRISDGKELWGVQDEWEEAQGLAWHREELVKSRLKENENEINNT